MNWLWWFPMIFLLWHMPCVIVIFKQRSFGAPWQKGTLFLHSSPTLHRLGEEFTENNEPADLPLIVLRGTCMWEGQQVFTISLAQAYPPDLGNDACGLRHRGWGGTTHGGQSL